MNGDTWWKGVFHAHQLVRTVTDTMLSGKSVLLVLPGQMPWHALFRREIEDGLRSEDSRQELNAFPSPEGDVGEYLFETYCRKAERVRYSRRYTYAGFLAKSQDTVLRHRYVYVTDVPEDHVAGWSVFLREYLQSVPAGQPHAVFLLEVQREPAPVRGLETVRFSDHVTWFDRYAFCALATSDADVPGELRPYLAELAAATGGADIELSAACIEEGVKFLMEPAEALEGIGEEFRSDGAPFHVRTARDTVEESLWESQLKVLFPRIQQQMRRLIGTYADEIERALPIETPYAAVIADPGDVEPGMLVYLCGDQKVQLSQEDYEDLILCRDVRNSLAHMTPVSFSAVERIMAL